MKHFTLLEGLLWFVLVLGVLLHLFVRPDYSRRNVEFMPNMVESPGYESQDANPNFEDGMTLRAPVEGTVPRGHLPLMHDGRMLDVSRTEWSKLPAAAQADWDAYKPHWDWAQMKDEERKRVLARGGRAYKSICATCHGLGGTAGTEVTKRGMPPPPSLLDDKMRQLSSGRMYRAITAGQANMPPHANQVPREERWMVIRYIRQLQKPKE